MHHMIFEEGDVCGSTRAELDGKLAEDEFGFSLEVAGFAPVNLRFHFGDLERVLETAERMMPDRPWLEQVEGVVRELKAAGDDERKRAVALTALHLAQNLPTEARCACSAKMTMLEQEQKQHFEEQRVYLVMLIDAAGGVEVALHAQDWSETDHWMFDLDDNELDRHLSKARTLN